MIHGVLVGISCVIIIEYKRQHDVDDFVFFGQYLGFFDFFNNITWTVFYFRINFTNIFAYNPKCDHLNAAK